MPHERNVERIVTDPAISDGTPVIHGSHIPVWEILRRAVAGMSVEEIIAELPDLDLADVQAALAYAVNLMGRGVGAELTLPRDDGLPPEDEPPALDLNRILIVDDHQLNRLHLQAMFKASEFNVSVASDGDEALAKARAELPFLILSDVQMPRMDGFEMCRQIKADERTRGAAVIFVTAHHRSSQKVSEGLDMGADDYIFRPFERNELLSRVHAVARLKRAEEEARRQARTVARRNRQLELLNDLSLVVTSSLDFQQISASVINTLSELLGADAVSLLVVDSDAQDYRVHFASRGGGRFSITNDLQPDWELTAQFIEEKVPALLAGILNAAPNAHMIDVNLDPCAMTCVPMISKGQIIGAIAILDRPERSLTAADWVLLNSATAIVAVAVENARLLGSAQQQMADLILLNEIGRALTSTLDLDQILEHTTQLVQESLRAEIASLWLLDEAGAELVLTASSGPGARLMAGFRLPVDSGIAGYVAQTGEPFYSPDVLAEGVETDGRLRDADFPHGSILCVPVQVKDQIIGVVQAYHQKPRQFDQNDFRLLYAVANSVGIAIENARLFGQVQEFNRRLERKVVERTRELAEEQERTEAILASMVSGLLVLDADNRVLTANTVAETLLDFRLGEMLGQPIDGDRLGHPLWRCIHAAVGGDDPVSSTSVDIPDLTQASGVVSIQALASRVRDELGQNIGTVIALHDITAIKEVERIKARFMAGVTHELKTPLSVIRLHANNLQAYSHRLSERKRHELLEAIQVQTRLLEQLVEDILALSRLDAGEARGQRHSVDLTEVAAEVVAELVPLASGKRVTLGWNRPEHGWIVLAERGQIRRMLRNLVDNAIKYTLPQGTVDVRLVPEGEHHVKLQVADTGMGIPTEHQVRVFDRFYRVDPSHTIPGTGLGLSIVKEIAAAYGGEIHLESRPGEGSVFSVTLPAIRRFLSLPATVARPGEKKDPPSS